MNQRQEPYASLLALGLGGVWWQGGSAAAAYLLAADWATLSGIPLVCASAVPALPSGGTEFPPLLTLDFVAEGSLEITAQLAHHITHEAKGMGIRVLGLPPAVAWSRDPDTALRRQEQWRSTLVSEPIILLTDEDCFYWHPAIPIPQVIAALQQGCRCVITAQPLPLLQSLQQAIDQGELEATVVQAASSWWLGQKKQLFPETPALQSLNQDGIPTLQSLLGDQPLATPWEKFRPPQSLSSQHPWYTWRTAAAQTLAHTLALAGIESYRIRPPWTPDWAWIWTDQLPDLNTPALGIPIRLGIPHAISHPLSDPLRLENAVQTHQHTLIQWFTGFTPPPLFWHWLHTTPPAGVIIYGQHPAVPDMLHLCEKLGIPCTHALCSSPEVQTHLLQRWLKTDNS